jgi:hypothetical protein
MSDTKSAVVQHIKHPNSSAPHAEARAIAIVRRRHWSGFQKSKSRADNAFAPTENENVRKINERVTLHPPRARNR